MLTIKQERFGLVDKEPVPVSSRPKYTTAHDHD